MLKIRKNTQKEHKIAKFADDILMYLGHPSESIPELLITLREYSLLSGYKLNAHKTQILSFNYSPSQSIREELNVNWDSKTIQYLGVTIAKNLDTITSENYDPLFSKIESDLVRWSCFLF